MTLLDFEQLQGFGSVHGAPNLPPEFTTVFESYHIPANGVRHHAVIGGQGRPLLLLAGWPQNWFVWRYLMLDLAREFTVIAVDPRGVGRSDLVQSGYDSDTLAADMLELMAQLGHQKFAMAGHDIGMWTGFAMAADQPGRIERIALGEAVIPGISVSPPLISDDRATNDRLWHFNFNRALGINEDLVVGREALYFGHQFATKAARPDSVPHYAQAFYIEQLSASRAALAASFEYYRAIDQSIPQNRRRLQNRVTIPVLAFAGRMGTGPRTEQQVRIFANDVTSVVIDDCGHYPAEEKPAELLSSFQEFFRPYAAAA